MDEIPRQHPKGSRQLREELPIRARRPPEHPDPAARHRADEREQRHARRVRHRRADRETGQQRDGDPGGDHLAERLEARRPKPLPFDRTDEMAHAQRLVTQAVTLLEQEDVLVGERGHRHRLAAPGERVIDRRRQHEVLLEQQLALQTVVVDRRGDDGHIEPALPETAQQLLGLLLDDQQLELREPPVHRRDDVRQEIRSEGREDAEPDRRRSTGSGSTGRPRGSHRPRAAAFGRARPPPGRRRWGSSRACLVRTARRRARLRVCGSASTASAD